MKYKSLLTDEIEVRIWKKPTGHYWSTTHSVDVDTGVMMNGFEDFASEEMAKQNFIATAKRNGWRKWRFVE